MSVQRACDVCGFYRQGRTHRYGLSRQMLDPTKTRRGGNPAYKRQQNFGGIDMCDECWQKIGAPKQRPELRGRTGPKEAGNEPV